MKKVIIIGASSGIGEALAREFSAHGFIVGMTARRIELLDKIKGELPNTSYTKQMDLLDPDGSIKGLNDLIGEMGNVDIIVINSGVGHINPDLVWGLEKATIDVNVVGFTAMAVASTNYFMKKRQGHIVGISSVAAVRPYRDAPAYGASKSYDSFYLGGLRHKFRKQHISIDVTSVMPGFVYTPLTSGNTKMYWASTPQKAAKQIYDAIIAKKEVVYITKRWRFVAWVMKWLPNFIYNRF